MIKYRLHETPQTYISTANKDFDTFIKESHKTNMALFLKLFLNHIILATGIIKRKDKEILLPIKALKQLIPKHLFENQLSPSNLIKLTLKSIKFTRYNRTHLLITFKRDYAFKHKMKIEVKGNYMKFPLKLFLNIYKISNSAQFSLFFIFLLKFKSRTTYINLQKLAEYMDENLSKHIAKHGYNQPFTRLNKALITMQEQNIISYSYNNTHEQSALTLTDFKNNKAIRIYMHSTKSAKQLLTEQNPTDSE